MIFGPDETVVSDRWPTWLPWLNLGLVESDYVRIAPRPRMFEPAEAHMRARTEFLELRKVHLEDGTIAAQIQTSEALSIYRRWEAEETLQRT